jgi:hypothetical protein
MASGHRNPAIRLGRPKTQGQPALLHARADSFFFWSDGAFAGIIRQHLNAGTRSMRRPCRRCEVKYRFKSRTGRQQKVKMQAAASGYSLHSPFK